MRRKNYRSSSATRRSGWRSRGTRPPGRRQGEGQSASERSRIPSTHRSGTHGGHSDTPPSAPLCCGGLPSALREGRAPAAVVTAECKSSLCHRDFCTCTDALAKQSWLRLKAACITQAATTKRGTAPGARSTKGLSAGRPSGRRKPQPAVTAIATHTPGPPRSPLRSTQTNATSKGRWWVYVREGRKGESWPLRISRRSWA